MRLGRKICAGGLVVLGSLFSSGIAFADVDDSHSVAYEILSFRYLAAGADVNFLTVRQGDVVLESGGYLEYATTLTGDKVEVKLDANITNGIKLGAQVIGSIAPGNPCVAGGGGTPQFAESTMTLSEGGVVQTAAFTLESPYNGGDESPLEVESSLFSPLELSSSSPKSLITGITNCGVTASPAKASVVYILDTSGSNLSPSNTQTAAAGGEYEQGTNADSVVTFTLKA